LINRPFLNADLPPYLSYNFPFDYSFRTGFKRNSRHLDEGENDEGGGGGGGGPPGLGIKEGGRGKPGFLNEQNNKRFGPRNNLNMAGGGGGGQGGEQWNDFRQQRNNRHFNNLR
jgi:hypothetical protein